MYRDIVAPTASGASASPASRSRASALHTDALLRLSTPRIYRLHVAIVAHFPSRWMYDLVLSMASPLHRWPMVLCIGVCTACSTALYADMTREVIRCETPGDIDISELHASREGPSWWTARCGEEIYFCSLLHHRPICSTLPPDTELSERPAPRLDEDGRSDPAPAPSVASR